MKKNKKPMIIIGIVIVLCLIAAGIFALTANSAERRLTEQLELGRKYLEEMNYEQAIVAFEAAIAIDPKCEEAYLALAETYVAQGTGDSGVYLPREDIYVAAESVEKAMEVLEEGYSQTSSETISARLEELRDCYQTWKEGGASSAGNEPGAGGQDTDGSQASGSSQSGSNQTPGSSGAGGQGQPAIDENDPFVQFLNAPFTDENGFGDVTSLDAAVAYAESNGFVVDSDNLVQPAGDFYIYCGETGGYIDPETAEEVLGFEVSVRTTEDVGGSRTIYYHMVDYEIPAYSIETILADPGAMTKETVPSLGGFASFLAEHECFTVESILETIGLGDQELETGHQVETPYGTADIINFSYETNEYSNRDYIFIFQEDSNAPFEYIELGDFTQNGVAAYLNVAVGTRSLLKLRGVLD